VLEEVKAVDNKLVKQMAVITEEVVAVEEEEGVMLMMVEVREVNEIVLEVVLEVVVVVVMSV
jgi:hypothetical protein